MQANEQQKKGMVSSDCPYPTRDAPSPSDDDKPVVEGEKNTVEEEEEIDEKKRMIKLWEQWVPMEKDLFVAVRQAQLCMLQRIDEMLAERGVSYWICGGTLVGAVRHGGFIPHDDDVDIECRGRDFEAIAGIPPDPPFFTGFQTGSGTWEGHPVAKLKFFRGEFEVDVFERDSDLVEHKYFPSRAEAFPLKRYKFHNIQLWGPGNPGDYLDRCYGETWREEVRVWNHDFNWYHGAWFDPQKMALPLADYNAVVEAADIPPPVAEASSKASYQTFWRQHGEVFFDKYRKYRFQRTFRRNRAASEWRESQGRR